LVNAFDLKLGREIADNKIIRFSSNKYHDVIKTGKICPLETGNKPDIGK